MLTQFHDSKRFGSNKQTISPINWRFLPGAGIELPRLEEAIRNSKFVIEIRIVPAGGSSRWWWFIIASRLFPEDLKVKKKNVWGRKQIYETNWNRWTHARQPGTGTVSGVKPVAFGSSPCWIVIITLLSPII